MYQNNKRCNTCSYLNFSTFFYFTFVNNYKKKIDCTLQIKENKCTKYKEAIITTSSL